MIVSGAQGAVDMINVLWKWTDDKMVHRQKKEKMGNLRKMLLASERAHARNVPPSEEKWVGCHENGSRSIFAKIKITDLDLKTIMIQWTEEYRFPRYFCGVFPFPEEGRAKVWWSTDDSRVGANIDGSLKTVQKDNINGYASIMYTFWDSTKTHAGDSWDSCN